MLITTSTSSGAPPPTPPEKASVVPLRSTTSTPKSFSLGAVAALVGFVSCGGSVTPDGNSPPTNNSPPSGPVVIDAGSPSCKATASFTPPTINPPVAPSNACTTETINAIVDACISDLPGTKTDTCLAARETAANKACADCIFGSKADANWKVITIDQGKAAHFNQAGCIENITGVPGCGKAYVTILECVVTFCGDATTQPPGRCDERTTPACFDEVKTTECRPFLLGNEVTANDRACSSALQSKQAEVEQTCFVAAPTRAAERAFFVNIVKTSCMKQ